MMIVPGFRVVPCDKKEMILGIEKMRSLNGSTLNIATFAEDPLETAFLDRFAI
jgi:hypothetical protein